MLSKLNHTELISPNYMDFAISYLGVRREDDVLEFSTGRSSCCGDSVAYIHLLSRAWPVASRSNQYLSVTTLLLPSHHDCPVILVHRHTCRAVANSPQCCCLRCLFTIGDTIHGFRWSEHLFFPSQMPFSCFLQFAFSASISFLVEVISSSSIYCRGHKVIGLMLSGTFVTLQVAELTCFFISRLTHSCTLTNRNIWNITFSVLVTTRTLVKKIETRLWMCSLISQQFKQNRLKRRNSPTDPVNDILLAE